MPTTWEQVDRQSSNEAEVWGWVTPEGTATEEAERIVDKIANAAGFRAAGYKIDVAPAGPVELKVYNSEKGGQLQAGINLVNIPDVGERVLVYLILLPAPR